MTVGERIKSERERLGFKQPEFAAIGHTTRKSQIDYEKDITQPRVDYLIAISKVGADILYIITGERSKPVEDTLTPKEKTLLESFRKAPEAVQNAAIVALLSGGQAPAGLEEPKTRKGRAAPKKNKVVVKGNNTGNVAGGDIIDGK